jgi:uncharacterized protein YgiB involved in biofilm formation
MGATMRTKIGTAEFNKHLSDLVRCALEDGQMNVYEIIGCCQAASNYADRCALAAAQQAQAKALSNKIIPAITIPPNLK